MRQNVFEGRRAATLSALLGVVLLVGLVGSFSDAGTRQLAMQLCTYLVLVVGLSMFVGNSGVTSFGNMAYATVGAYAAALVTASPGVKTVLLPQLPSWLQQTELPTYLGVLIGVLTAFLFAALSALPLSRLNGVAASISTLALLAIVYNIVRNWDGVTGGTGSFPGVPLSSSLWSYCGCAAVAVIVAFVYEGSRFGLRLQATREDEPAARAIGIGIAVERQRGLVLSATFTALGGVMFCQLIGVLSPSTLYLSITFLTIAMLVIGGINSLTGAVLGTTLVFVLDQLLRAAESGSIGPLHGRPGMSQFLLATFMLVVLIASPKGLVGLRWKGRLGRMTESRRRSTGEVRDGSATPDPRLLPDVPSAPPSTHPAPVVISSPVDPEAASQLALRGVTVTFDGINALTDVDLTVHSGETVGLIGPNGAGKSTIINVATGFLRPNTGAVHLGTRDITNLRPEGRLRHGLARSFQAVRPFGELTLFQNVEVSALASGSSRKEARELTGSLLEGFDLIHRAPVLARTLSAGEQRQLGVLRALASNPRFILLDEPAAGLDETETAELVAFIRGLTATHGVGLLIIEHDMSVIMPLCQRVYVLNFGRVIADGPPATIRGDEAVIAAYLGTAAARELAPESSSPDPKLAT